MNRTRLSRPSLKITRDVDQRRDSRFTVEVWNPFVSAYQAVPSVQDGLTRVAVLADLISRMWVQRHPKRDLLVDVPDTAATVGPIWAEFRINATTYRSYDTRSDDRPTWASATDLTQAASRTCAKVNYMLPGSSAS